MIEISCSEDCEPPPWYDSLSPLIAKILTTMALVRVELSVLLCGIATIQALNARYRGRNAPTDVLTFFQYEHGYDYPLSSASEGDSPAPEGYNNLGDIVISLPIAVRNAARAARTELEEVTHLIVHGVLHILGFDHTHTASLEHDCMMITQRCVYRAL